MVAIFTTASVLDNICHTDTLSVWKDMIVKLGEVFIDDEIDIPLDDEDPLFILDSAIKIDKSKKDYIQSRTSLSSFYKSHVEFFYWIYLPRKLPIFRPNTE